MAQGPLLFKFFRLFHQFFDVEVQHFLSVLADPLQTAIIRSLEAEMLIHVGLNNGCKLGDDFEVFFQGQS